MEIKIVTLNVNGLANRKKRKQIFRNMYDKSANIVCLQETHAVKKAHKFWKNEWGGQIYFSDGETNARGVAILFDSKFQLEQRKVG